MARTKPCNLFDGRLRWHLWLAGANNDFAVHFALPAPSSFSLYNDRAALSAHSGPFVDSEPSLRTTGSRQTKEV